MVKITIKGNGPVLNFDGDEYCRMYEPFSNVKPTVLADSEDITDKLGEPIVGPLMAEEIDFYIVGITEEGNEEWENEIEIDVEDFDPSKLQLFFVCDNRDPKDGEFFRCSFDGARDLKASYYGNMLKYDGKNYCGDFEY